MGGCVCVPFLVSLPQRPEEVGLYYSQFCRGRTESPQELQHLQMVLGGRAGVQCSSLPPRPGPPLPEHLPALPTRGEQEEWPRMCSHFSRRGKPLPETPLPSSTSRGQGRGLGLHNEADVHLNPSFAPHWRGGLVQPTQLCSGTTKEGAPASTSRGFRAD